MEPSSILREPRPGTLIRQAPDPATPHNHAPEHAFRAHVYGPDCPALFGCCQNVARFPGTRLCTTVIETWGRSLLAHVELPVVRFLLWLRVTPNLISWTGLWLAVATACLIAAGWIRWGGLAYILVSGLDSLDGLLARKTGRVTRYGACLDSTFDRLSEICVLLGLLIHLQLGGPMRLPLSWSIPLTAAVIGTSVVVSYVKARAEGLEIPCKAGWLQRSERIVLLGAGLMLNVADVVLIPMCLALLVTIGQRLHYVARHDRGLARDE
ncbi:MAG: CDP-alcohol phosphatidyltransferase family protein [Caldilineaceae bacterium SB0665_bin_21]|nr:CDP-alcohol phosphatidyltransferase family protein [Caldilineaceae bacterium SB0665_bin_21]